MFVVNGHLHERRAWPWPQGTAGEGSKPADLHQLAVTGDKPPRGFSDGGQPQGTAPAVQEFRGGTHALTPRAGLRG